MFCFPLGIWNPPCFHLAQELLQLNFERTNPQPWDLSLMTKYLKWSHLDLLVIFDSGLRSGTCALIHQQQKVQLPALSAQVIGNPWVSILWDDGPKGETLVNLEQPTSQWWKGTIYSRFCELTLASRECVEIEDYAMLFYLVFCPSRCKMSILKYGALKLLDRRCLVADLDRSLESAALWCFLYQCDAVQIQLMPQTELKFEMSDCELRAIWHGVNLFLNYSSRCSLESCFERRDSWTQAWQRDQVIQILMWPMFLILLCIVLLFWFVIGFGSNETRPWCNLWYVRVASSTLHGSAASCSELTVQLELSHDLEWCNVKGI